MEALIVLLRADTFRGGGDCQCSLLPHRPGIECGFQRSGNILSPNRLASLLGSPGRERAPVGARAGPVPKGRRQLVIALRDLQVADDRIAKCGNPINLDDVWSSARVCDLRPA
jgi:hypothetical protein